MQVTCRFIVLFSLACTGVAQQPQSSNPEQPSLPQATPQAQASPQASPPPAPTPKPQTGASRQPEQPSSEREIQKKEQSQRILGVVPQFGVTSRQNAPPLTSRQKFHLFVKGSFDPFVYLAAGFQAGIGQATNSFPAYGQGAAGYGKRFGAALADQVSSNFFSNFAYPVLLKEDPRYFRIGEGTIKHRIVYSLEQEFVTRTDKGTRRFNYSNVLGAFTAGGLSNAYYPPNDRGFGLTMSRVAISLVYGSAGGLVDEFWFDIDQKLFHKKKKTKPQLPPDSSSNK